jgi:hypothetical protein
LLKKLIKNKGRVPVFGFYGNVGNIDNFKSRIKTKFPNYASASTDEVNFSSDSDNRATKKNFYLNAMMMILDPKTECMLLNIDSLTNPIELPVDVIDVLFIGDYNQDANEQNQNRLDMILKASDNYVNISGLYKAKGISKEINIDLNSKESIDMFLDQVADKHSL